MIGSLANLLSTTTKDTRLLTPTNDSPSMNAEVQAAFLPPISSMRRKHTVVALRNRAPKKSTRLSLAHIVVLVSPSASVLARLGSSSFQATNNMAIRVKGA